MTVRSDRCTVTGSRRPRRANHDRRPLVTPPPSNGTHAPDPAKGDPDPRGQPPKRTGQIRPPATLAGRRRPSHRTRRTCGGGGPNTRHSQPAPALATRRTQQKSRRPSQEGVDPHRHASSCLRTPDAAAGCPNPLAGQPTTPEVEGGSVHAARRPPPWPESCTPAAGVCWPPRATTATASGVRLRPRPPTGERARPEPRTPIAGVVVTGQPQAGADRAGRHARPQVASPGLDPFGLRPSQRRSKKPGP